jgi:hypothetical protein
MRAMSRDLEAYLVFAFFTGMLLYMLLLYVQTRRPESLLSGQHRVTRFERIVSRILSIATWPVVCGIAMIGLRDQVASTVNFVRDPWNPDVPFMASVLLHGGPLAIIVVLYLLGGTLRSAHRSRRGLDE